MLFARANLNQLCNVIVLKAWLHFFLHQIREEHPIPPLVCEENHLAVHLEVLDLGICQV